MEEQFVVLEKIAGGAVGEQFAIGFQELIANVCDPNTDPRAARSITIELVLKPTEQRNFATYSLRVKTKLAPEEPIIGSFRIGRIGNQLEATEVIEPPAPILTAISNMENQHV
jgi:hypothetical protein